MGKRFFGLILGVSLLCISGAVQASTILYVHDVLNGDDSIATVLTGDGHSVTSLTGGYDSTTAINTDLIGDLSIYDSIFWNASGSGSGNIHDAAQFTDLMAYVIAGGRVFVTGHDAIASPPDYYLVTFLGGTSSTDWGGLRNPGPVTGENSLSTGVFDIQGILPLGAIWNDWDTLYGLGSETVCVAASSVPGGCQWSIRTVGEGEIAFISAGAPDRGTESAWSNEATTGVGAYNAALRNFAYVAPAAKDEVTLPEPAPMALLGLGLMGLGLARKRRR
ncbi:MAG: hypothetical protein COB54_07575 [Alphaproteobacteria bacterium]|nr:MAG: hypothetical protein COB54_07575 [Alphaproteobacteria bacterium]